MKPLRRDEIIFYLALGVAAAIGLTLGVAGWIVAAAALAVSVSYAVLAETKLRRNQSQPAETRGSPADSKYAVRCTEEGIAVDFEGQLQKSARWDDLLVVGIGIDESFLPQPWWVIGTSTGRFIYPSDAKGWETAHQEMSRRLVGFDHGAMIKAAGMLSGGVVLWEKKNA